MWNHYLPTMTEKLSGRHFGLWYFWTIWWFTNTRTYQTIQHQKKKKRPYVSTRTFSSPLLYVLAHPSNKGDVLYSFRISQFIKFWNIANYLKFCFRVCFLLLSLPNTWLSLFIFLFILYYWKFNSFVLLRSRRKKTTFT